MPFTLKNEILLSKKLWRGKEIFPEVGFEFTCNNCKKVNRIGLGIEGPGRIVKELYHNSGEFDKNDFLQNSAVYETRLKNEWYDLVTSSDLPALYVMKNCQSCGTKHIIIYGVGESQPGRDILEVSGVWEIE